MRLTKAMAAFGQRSVLFLWIILFTFHSKAQSSLSSCDAGWTKSPSSKSCIKIFGTEVSGRKTWSNARLTCQQSEGDLVTIRHAGMTALIKKTRRSTRIKLKPRESGYWTGFWIGLHDRYFENNWIWLDENETAIYTNWSPRQPDDWYLTKGEDCAMALLRDARWNDLTCAAKMPYICERPILSSAVGQCPAKWSKNPSTGTCIQMGGQPKRWQAARAECKKRGGDLVTIVDDYMNTFVNKIRKESVDEISWIGLNKMPSGGNFSWSNENQQVKYTKWAAKNSGKNSKVKNCVVTGVNDVGEWAALKCAERRDFICERQPVCPLVDGICPSGWIKSPDSCIKFYDQERTWTDAREVCKKDDADLVTILDECMSKMIEVQLKSKSGAYWIGLSDQHKEGRWRWLNGNNTVIYKKWAPGQPSNHQVLGHKKGQDCGEVGRYKLGQWNDHDCITAQKFICEKPAKNANQSVGVLIGIIIAAILVLCGAIIAGILFGPKLYRAARERMEKKMDSAIGVTNTIAQSM